jgi:hypothetical protein
MECAERGGRYARIVFDIKQTNRANRSTDQD